MHSPIRKFISGGLLVVAVVTNPAAATEWEFIDLGAINEEGDTLGYGLNESGMVVGCGWDPSPGLPLPPQAFCWENGSGMLDLGTASGLSTSGANDVNEAGRVAGEGDDTAFVWDSVTGFTFIDVGSSIVACEAINDLGQAVGGGDNRAFLWDDGAGLTDLGNLGYSAQATGINNSGQVTGWGRASAPSGNHAFLITPVDGLWYRDDDEDGINDLMIDLGTLAGRDHAKSYDINVHGDIVGISYDSSGPGNRGFLYRDGAMEDLGGLGGDVTFAYAINDANEIVGYSKLPNGDQHAVLWRNGTIYDLNEVLPPGSGWVLWSAHDINNRGWITGWGVTPDDYSHAYLLKPIPDPTPTVSAWGAVVMALLLLVTATVVLRHREQPRPDHGRI